MKLLSKTINKFALPCPWLIGLIVACLLATACGQHDHDSHDHAGGDHAEAAEHGEAHEAYEGHNDHGEEMHASTEHAEHDGHADDDDAEPGDGHDGHDDHAEGLVTISDDMLREFDIELAAAGPNRLHKEVVLPGEIKFNRERLAYVTPRYPGTITGINARLADEVKQGQVLATLESTETLRPFEVKAPFTGTIVAYEITPGETVEAGMPLFTVADLTSVWADLRIYQRDLNKVHQGQRVVVVNGHEGPQFTGTINYIAPTIDEHTRTGLARIVVENQGGEWRPGQFVKGSVAIDEHRADVVIPRSAVLTHEGDLIVFVQTEEGFELRPVVLGESDATSHEVLSGLKSGDTYVSRNAISLKAEMNKGSFGGHAGHVH